jgi:RecA/RadA recombinase
VAFGQRAAEDGEILAEDIDEPAVDRPRSGDDAVAGDHLIRHAEIDAIVLDVHVDLFERSFVEQDLQPFAGGELALGMLRGDPFLAAARSGGGSAAVEFGLRR